MWELQLFYLLPIPCMLFFSFPTCDIRRGDSGINYSFTHPALLHSYPLSSKIDAVSRSISFGRAGKGRKANEELDPEDHLCVELDRQQGLVFALITQPGRF